MGPSPSPSEMGLFWLLSLLSWLEQREEACGGFCALLSILFCLERQAHRTASTINVRPFFGTRRLRLAEAGSCYAPSFHGERMESLSVSHYTLRAANSLTARGPIAFAFCNEAFLLSSRVLFYRAALHLPVYFHPRFPIPMRTRVCSQDVDAVESTLCLRKMRCNSALGKREKTRWLFPTFGRVTETAHLQLTYR